MKFDHPDFEDTWFTVKDEPTMRDILLYDGAIQGRMVDTLYTRLWAGAKWLIDEWHVEGIDPEADAKVLLDGKYDHRKVELLKWVSLAVFSYRKSLEPEKN